MEHAGTDSRGRKKNRRLLFLLDEFPTLGRLEFFNLSLRQMAGYGSRLMLIVQSFNDIAEHYGAINSILDNCHVVVCFASVDTRTCQRDQRNGRGSGRVSRKLLSAAHRKLTGQCQDQPSEQVRPSSRPGKFERWRLTSNSCSSAASADADRQTAVLRRYPIFKRVWPPPKTYLPAELPVPTPRKLGNRAHRGTPVVADVAQLAATEQGEDGPAISPRS